MNVVHVKPPEPGKPPVSFAVIAEAGFRLLSAIEQTARDLGLDLTITCGCEGHAPLDPHTLGAAYDIRSHDLSATDKQKVLSGILKACSENDPDVPLAVSSGIATRHFWGWIEHPGEDAEHIHCQRRIGVNYP